MKTKLLMFTLLLTCLLASCSDEEIPGISFSSEKGFNLSYTVNNSTLTRSTIDVVDGEDEITSFYILFFENTTGGTGLFIEGIDAMASYGGTLSTSGKINITFPENSSLTNTASYIMLLCANIERYTEMSDFEALNTFCTGKTENEVKFLLQQISGVTPGSGEEEDDSKQILSDHLPMSTTLVKSAGVREVVAELIRTVARFDVYSEADGYELVSASIWNSYSEGYLWEGNLTNYTAPRTERFYGVEATDNKIIGALYAFENYVVNPEQSDKKSTCLIVGLRKISGNGSIEYFRTNVHVSEEFGQRIKRNNVYTTIIKGVQSQGYLNERDAYEGDESRLLNISFSHDEIKVSTTASISTATFSITSNAEWDAELIVERGTQAGFNTAYTQQTTSGNGNVDNIKVYVPAYYGNQPSRIIVRATIKNTNISADLLIYQDSYYSGTLFITNNSTVNGNLVNPDVYTVYNLGKNMRNEELFGTGGSVVDMSGGFHFMTSTDVNVMKEARIIQLSATPDQIVFNNVYDTYQADPSKLLIISSVSYAIQHSTLQMLQTKSNLGYGTLETVRNLSSNYRKMSTEVNRQHPLIQYLLNGPAGTILNPDDILLQAASHDSGGLKNGSWPSTFVPIIMSSNEHNSSQYCVFGIDPVNRLILMMNIGLFGADGTHSGIINSSIYNNRNNYVEEDSANTIFLNNFIAWMAQVATEGESFLSQFQ